jgi:hypothetical protein
MYKDHNLLDVRLSSMVDGNQHFREMCRRNSCMAKNRNYMRSKGPGQGYKQANKNEHSLKEMLLVPTG